MKLASGCRRERGNFIAKFEADLDPAVAGSEQFAHRVLLTRIKGPKNQRRHGRSVR
jgi:hypothetical protein